MAFVAINMGRWQDARSGAYLNGYVTDEQRSRRPIFIATLRAAAKTMLFVGQDTKIKSCLIRPPEAPAVFILFLDRQVKQ